MNRKSQVELTSMCLICDETRILVEEKCGTSYPGGLVFPGGHVEKNESLQDSVIREMKEETGLTIKNPKLCGVKDWIEKERRTARDILFCCTKQINSKEN